MKIAVFGATGRTGRQVVLQALAQGHEVTAIVRSVDGMPRFDRLRVVTGDALDPDSFADALAGQDAVISTLGVSGFLHSLRPMTFYDQSAVAIFTAMRRRGIERVVLTGSVGVLPHPSAPLWYRALVKPLLRHKYADMRRMEAAAATSGLAWTVVRAAQLVDGPLTQQYRVGDNGSLADIGKITTADLADLLISQATGSALARKAIAISY